MTTHNLERTGFQTPSRTSFSTLDPASRRRRVVRLAIIATATAVTALLAAPASARNERAVREPDPSTTPLMADPFVPPPGGPPNAEAVYRCGNSYSPRPCANTAPLEVDDSRSAAQRAQARDVAARDKRLADFLEAQRRLREGPAVPVKKVRTRAAKGCVPSRTLACPSKAERSRHAIAKTAKTAKKKAATTVVQAPGEPATGAVKGAGTAPSSPSR